MRSNTWKSWLERISRLTLLGRVIALLLVMIVVYMAVAPIAVWLHGLTGAAAAAVALVFCLLGGLGALIVSDLCRGPRWVLVRVLGAMLLRMGLPLGMSLAVYARGGPLVDAGLAYYVVGFYLVMLAVETLMLIPEPHGCHGAAGVS